MTDLQRDRHGLPPAATTLSSTKTTGWMSSPPDVPRSPQSQRPPRRTESSPSTEMHSLACELSAAGTTPSSAMARMHYLSFDRFQLGHPLDALPLQWTTDHAAAVSSLPPRRRPRRATYRHNALPQIDFPPASLDTTFHPRQTIESFTQRHSSRMKDRRNGRRWLATRSSGTARRSDGAFTALNFEPPSSSSPLEGLAHTPASRREGPVRNHVLGLELPREGLSTPTISTTSLERTALRAFHHEARAHGAVDSPRTDHRERPLGFTTSLRFPTFWEPPIQSPRSAQRLVFSCEVPSAARASSAAIS